MATKIMSAKTIEGILQKTKIASRIVAVLPETKKNSILRTIAGELIKNTGLIIKHNKLDLTCAKANHLTPAMIDRLMLNAERIKSIAESINDIISLPDPVGTVTEHWRRPNGITISRVHIPLGVICMIYESRPNVTIDAAALCLKSGNAVLLRGGSEAFNSNLILSKIVGSALERCGIPKAAVTYIPSTGREVIYRLLKMNKYIDVVIPRGSKAMVESIISSSTIPVLAHGSGNCHVYIDSSADIPMALKIAYNAKVQRPGVCNAAEKLLVHKRIAGKFLPLIAEQYKTAGVKLRGCRDTARIIKLDQPATEQDWPEEYLGLTIAIKVVPDIDSAIEHINKYSSAHTECIVTKNRKAAEKFLARVDSSCVLHNASTRLHDGGVFGLGAEVGISTQKLHARGTMGIKELTSLKYVVKGNGQIRE
ncbi:MAG: glutamate-5-semialdehyde dehydrogenase [Elusimicrobiota bacterium]